MKLPGIKILVSVPGSVAMALFLMILLAVPGGLSAQTLYVKKSGTKLRSKDSAKAEVIAKLAKGTPIKVTRKGKKFYKVKTAKNQTGWIFKFKLTAKAPSGSSGKGDFLGALGGQQKMAANASSSDSSIRGLSPIAENRAREKGVPNENIEAVKQMENFRITSKELDDFLLPGKLGEYAP